MSEERRLPNWWKAGRHASFVLCAGDLETFDEWMAGSQGQSLARHLARHTRWRMVTEQEAGQGGGTAAEKQPRRPR